MKRTTLSLPKQIKLDNHLLAAISQYTEDTHLYSEKIKSYIEEGADINHNNSIALTLAITNNCLITFAFLIDNGATVL